MAAQTGTLWTLGVRTTGGASPVYANIAGLRTRSFKLNNNPVDATTSPDAYFTCLATISSSSVTLPTTFSDGSTVSAVNSYYVGESIIVGGTSYPITAYNGTTRVATVTGTPTSGSQSILISNPASTDRWRVLLGDTGTVELEISGAGLYQKDAPTHLLPSLVASGASQVFQLLSSATSAGISIVGSFVVSEYEITATYNEAVAFTVKLTSTASPTITYTPTATVPA
jgi:predicted secreted protein